MTDIDMVVMDSVEGRGITQEIVERVVRDSIVDEYLENFAGDPSYKNATALVRRIMEIERSGSYGND